jgi:S-adenosylmethionine:tRNA ribosyltransferase-isomerase
MRTDDLDFALPPELIAQSPSIDRSASRLLHYTRATGEIFHRTFSELQDLLRNDDVLVFNDARVLPARFLLRKETGGLIEGLFLQEQSPCTWRALLRNLAGRIDQKLVFADDPSVVVRVISKGESGEYVIQPESKESTVKLLSRLGRMPLPPYIKRGKQHDDRDTMDRQHYQTVYAKNPGSVAAPTAGLHFTQKLLHQIDARGIERVQLTLHVGMGTFKPVTADTLEAHDMHTERYEVDAIAAEKLNSAKDRRIVAVGTTSARVLESYPDQPWQPTTAETSIFIYPPYQWKRVDALITNFHLPRSTLIALVAAMVGLEEQRRIYKTAIENRYRFFSYGDAMFID